MEDLRGWKDLTCS
jgi:hypothetical protein